MSAIRAESGSKMGAAGTTAFVARIALKRSRAFDTLTPSPKIPNRSAKSASQGLQVRGDSVPATLSNPKSASGLPSEEAGRGAGRGEGPPGGGLNFLLAAGTVVLLESVGKGFRSAWNGAKVGHSTR